MSVLERINLLATQPGRFFQDLDARPTFWFPLLLSMAVTAVGLVAYYTRVDIAWFADQVLSSNAQMAQLTDVQREQAARYMTRNVLLYSSLLGGLVAVVGQSLLQALYLLVASKVTRVTRSYRHWLALTCWVGLPLVLSGVAGLVLLALQPGSQFPPDVMQPLSLNSLFFNRPMGHGAYSLLSALTLLHPVAWALAVVGLRQWSGRPLAYSAGVVLLPVVLVYGIWAWRVLGGA